MWSCKRSCSFFFLYQHNTDSMTDVGNSNHLFSTLVISTSLVACWLFFLRHRSQHLQIIVTAEAGLSETCQPVVAGGSLVILKLCKISFTSFCKASLLTTRLMTHIRMIRVQVILPWTQCKAMLWISCATGSKCIIAFTDLPTCYPEYELKEHFCNIVLHIGKIYWSKRINQTFPFPIYCLSEPLCLGQLMTLRR